ncbi:L-aspartate oxidase [Rosettibacter primus]|uniref:L-aspartate oxidase n=1 Tax=Rosettibacter primus TaxID=3111523 RepID=UPI00336BE5DD
MNYVNYDFVIIGAGLAGLYSAYQASKYGTVALITKTTIEISNSYLAQGGIAAAIGNDDSPQLHYEDTIKAGRGLCNKEAVKILVNEGLDRVKELIELGMQFDKENGKISLGLEGGHSRNRVLHAGGDATGKEVVNFILKFIYDNEKIKIFENTLIYKLISKNNECTGAYAFNHYNNENFLITGKVIILATGGASAIFSNSTNPHTTVGEGLWLAYDIGVKVESMEFIQFHPTSFYTGTDETFLISEAVRGEGALLLNYDGKRFLQDEHLTELATRDLVSEAIFIELKKTGKPNVFLKLSHLDENKIKKRFSNIYKEALKYGIDITKDLVPVTPAAHYMVGGIKTGLNAETNIKRLYAVGEVASTGVHGANRLASNSLLECLVFSKRAIEHSLKYLKDESNEIDEFNDIKFYVDNKNKQNFLETKNIIAKLLWDNVGILRTKDSLLEALNQINNLTEKISLDENEYFAGRIISLINVAKMITKAALIREESRGCHRRKDFPEENENFRKLIVQEKGKEPILLPIS